MKNLFLLLTFVNFLSPCYAQFNTIKRDTLPVRLIGQEESIFSSPPTKESGVQPQSSEASSMDEHPGKYYEMPGADASQDPSGGMSIQGQWVQGHYSDQGQYSERKGKKSLWNKVFGRKKRKPKVPQIIIMPMQTVGLNGQRRDVIDEYSEDSERELSFRDLKVEDLERLDLLSQRSTVSMPLQRFYLTSKFGYRKDPLGQGTRFHDGVDLRCSYEPVFAMLPGVVTKVQYGNTGYGNYVVLNHGNIECLYGHLSDIGVSVGEAVQAGDVVAISGNTGRSTGPHLHLKMTYMGQRVDPLVFIDYINDYIHELQGKLYGDGTKDVGSFVDSDLNLENLIATMEHYGLHHQSIVLAQALLETGYFTSSVCRNKHNLFGLTRKDGHYYEFANWQESVKGYRDMIQYRYKGGDYYEFLRQVPYAEDPNYIYKVKQIEGQLGGYGLRLGEGGE